MENKYTDFVGSYLLPRKFGIDKRIVYLSAQVRSGVIDKEDAWDVLNAQVIFQSTVNPWYLKIWGKNLMDDDNQTGAYFTDPSSGQFRNDFFMDPRMIGITFGASF